MKPMTHIWEIEIGNKTIEGDDPRKYKKLLAKMRNRLRKGSKKAQDQRSGRIRG